MDAVDLGVNLFVALFALVDPIGNIPIFAAATAGASMRQRLSVSALICIFIVIFLCFFFFTGLGLLQFFGISLAAFRIAGGILLLLLGRRGDWATFATELPRFRMNDDREVRCYALLVQYLLDSAAAAKPVKTAIKPKPKSAPGKAPAKAAKAG